MRYESVCDCGENLQGSQVCGVCDCSEPIPTDVQSDCMTPCGGDVTGSWQLTDVCQPEFAQDSCDHYQRGGSAEILPSGLAFQEGGVLYGNLTLNASWDLQFSEACLYTEDLSCSDIAGGFFDEQFAYDCDDSDGCACTVEFARIADEFAGVAYTADGTALTLGIQGPFEYCVDGDELRFRVNENEITYVMQRSDCPVDLPNCETVDMPFVPANFPELQSVQLPVSDLTISGNDECDSLTLNTDTLEVSCGYGLYVRSELTPQGEGLPDAAVFYFGNLEIFDTFRVEGSRPAVIVAKSFRTSVPILYQTEMETSAPASARGQDATLSDVDASGGGGGHCTAGGRGGGAAGGLGGMGFDDVTSTTLWPGALGGANNLGEVGGVAGVALQLIVRDQIQVDSEASLLVEGGGRLNDIGDGARGGGSGGTLILQSPMVTVAGELNAAGGPAGGAPDVPRPAGSDGTAPGVSGGFDTQGGAGGSGKLLIFADTLNLTDATVVPHPDTAPACAQFAPTTAP